MRRLYKIGILCVLLSQLPLVFWAESKSVQVFLQNQQTRYANIGIYIKDLGTGKVIDSYRSKNNIPPASVIKLLTTATALEVLGADYRYSTFLEYTGTLSKGVLQGDLYIVGTGDPTLGSQKDGQGFLNRWVKAIQQAGIKKITGRVIADLSYFDGDAFNPAWLLEDAGNYYAPGIFALSYMDNTMNIVLKSGEPGTVAEIMGTSPEMPGLSFENHIRCTTIEEDGAYVYGLPYGCVRYLTGSVPSKRGSFGVKGDLPNPGLLLAHHLTRSLRSAGISVGYEASYIAESTILPRQRIYEHRSDSMGAIIKRTNYHSINLFAESIYRTLACKSTIPCTIHNSEMVVRSCWANRGVNLLDATLKDGCGLAPQDALSAENFVQVLEYMYHSPNARVFRESLPVGGKDGTVRSFLAGTELEGRTHVKSGTIGGTKNYAGYIDLPNGHKWAFAVMVNSATGNTKGVQHVIERYLLDVYRRNQ